MSEICAGLHQLFNSLPRFSFPYDESEIPLNGIYVLFQKGEAGHGFDRIVRIGTHTGNNQLRSRLKQHFMTEKKDRSIFRKNISRCFLNVADDPYLKIWELDLTSHANKVKYGGLIDTEYQRQIEERITRFLQENFSFSVFRVDSKDERLDMESKLIATVARCNECGPSDNWLGLNSPKDKIRDSGLWQVNGLDSTVLSKDELSKLAL